MTIKSEKKRLEHLLRDDFIADSDSDSEEETGGRRYSRVKPLGWDSLFFEDPGSDKTRKKLDSPDASAADVSAASVLQDGKMFLMQLPEQLLPLTDDQLLSTNGYIGRMRVYASGRVEFVDDTSANNIQTYDCLRSEESMSTLAIKEEDGSQTLVEIRSKTEPSCNVCREHVLLMEDEEAVSCGLLQATERLVLIPDDASSDPR